MIRKLSLILALAVFSTSTFAELIQSTTGVYLSFRNCVKGTTACDSISKAEGVKIGGMPGDSQAQAKMENPLFGAGSGEVKRTSEQGDLTMRANSSSVAGTRNGSNTYQMHRYTNNSAHPETLTYSGTLSFEQTVPAENEKFAADSPSRTTAHGEVVIMALNVDSLEAGTTAEDNMQLFQGGASEGIEDTLLAQASGKGSVNISGWGEEKFSASTVIQPGDSVWMFTIMQAIAANGALVKAGLESTVTIEN